MVARPFGKSKGILEIDEGKVRKEEEEDDKDL